MDNAYHANTYPHTVNDKYEALDWENLPHVTCDMNYRLPRPPSKDWSAIAARLAAAILGAVAAYVLLAVGGSLASIRLSSPTVCLAAWLFVTGLVIVHLADRVAKAHLGWSSANPRVPRQVMTAYRLAWRNRWQSGSPELPPADETTEAYRAINHELHARYANGPIWLVATLGLGLLAGLATAKVTGTPLVALAVLVQTTLLMAVAAAVRLQTLPQGLATHVIDALGDYLTSGTESAQPPWVYQEEDGPPAARLWHATLLAGVLSFFATAALVTDPYPSERLFSVLLLTSICLLATTPVWFAAGVLLVASPTVAAHHGALEIDGAFEHRCERDWDGYVQRLHKSRNPLERRCFWSGCHLQHQYPILIDQSLYDEHAHVVGPTGSGKTAMTLLSDAIQVVRRAPDSPDARALVIIDCKGDRAFFQTMRHEAAAAGREFKWFTNVTGLDSYVFNPLSTLASSKMSLAEVVGVIAQSLDLYHGEGYGRGFFGATARALLEAAYKTSFTFDPLGRRPPIASFDDLEEAIREECDDPQEMQAARHLLYVVAAMSRFPQLNMTGRLPGDGEEVRQAIHFPTVLRERQVVYFYLAGAIDLSSVGHIGRLALYSTMAAALEHRVQTGKPAGVHLIADEAQCLLSKNIEPILTQARSYGIACTLAHQSMSQLKRGDGSDLREIVTENTTIKRYHAVRDPESQKRVAAASGRALYYDMSWDQLKRRAVGKGQIDRGYACTGPDRVMRVGVTQRVGDRLEAEDLARMNRRIDQSVLLVDRGEGLTQLAGGVVLESGWPLDKTTYDNREREAWPEATPGTLGGDPPAADSPEHGPTTGTLDDVERRLREVSDWDPPAAEKGGEENDADENDTQT